MAAPNYTQLFDFDSNFRASALAAIAAANMDGIGMQESDKIPLTVITVAFTLGAADPDHTTVTNAEKDKFEYCLYRGCTLEVAIRVPRDDSGSPTADSATKLNYYAAKIRTVFRESERPMNTDLLKWYCVHRLKPAGETNIVIDGLNADAKVLRYDIDFEIMAAAWPAA